MSRILKELENDMMLDSLDDEDRPMDTPVKKCKFCGYKGALVLDLYGLACADCGVILVAKK